MYASLERPLTWEMLTVISSTLAAILDAESLCFSEAAATWPEAIAWLAKTAVAFKQAFAPRVAALES